MSNRPSVWAITKAQVIFSETACNPYALETAIALALDTTDKAARDDERERLKDVEEIAYQRGVSDERKRAENAFIAAAIRKDD